MTSRSEPTTPTPESQRERAKQLYLRTGQIAIELALRETYGSEQPFTEMVQEACVDAITAALQSAFTSGREAGLTALEQASARAEKLGDAEPEHDWSCDEIEMLGELRQVLYDAIARLRSEGGGAGG